MIYALCLASLALAADGIPAGKSRIDLEFDRRPVELFCYKPADYHAGPLLMVFHGVLRNGEEYRDHAQGMADRFKAIVVAPRFSEHEFPLDHYQMGGILADGKLRPQASWTGHLIPKIVAEIRQREKRPELPYYLIGHSGGGQFLIRLAAFVPTEAKRIVVANAGTLVFPSRDHFFPFGFGGLPAEASNDEAIKRYLAQPVTLYQGQDDIIRDEYFQTPPSAERQGKTRYERGKNLFATAKGLAESRGWPFGWKLVELPEVGHDHELMFGNAKVAEALGLAETK